MGIEYLRSMTTAKKIALSFFSLFFTLLLVHQLLSAIQLKRDIGLYAYSSVGHALQVIGRKGEYVGTIVDARWNKYADREEEIQGFQPRYLVAREVTSGVTETVWYCAYLIIPSETAPANIKPSPFPPYNDERPY
jgi:hypothetical protein